MTILRTVVLFVLAAVAEIGGAWLVWQAVREDKPWWWAGFGALIALLGVSVIIFAPRAGRNARPGAFDRIKSVKTVLKVSAVCIYDLSGRLLTVRKSGTTKFMHPGGKPELGESAAEAGSRELSEEVGISVGPADLELLGVWTGTAANEFNTDIEATVFTAPGTWDAELIRPTAEIAELRWMDISRASEHEDLAPLLTEYVLPRLTGTPNI